MRRLSLSLLLLPLLFLSGQWLQAAAAHKNHVIVLGVVKQMPYSRTGDPAGAAADEKILRVRPLLVDGSLKEWTTGDAHDVTDRSFVVRRAIRINDTLPGEKAGHWVWQRGPWIMVDRVTGHVTVFKLPDYDPAVSRVSWFRDYAAYCGLTSTGKILYAVVAQVGGRKPIMIKRIGPFNPTSHADPVCALVEWQREPMRTLFHPTGQPDLTFELTPGSAVLVEDSADEEDPSAAEKKEK